MNRLNALLRDKLAWHILLLLLVMTGFAARVAKKSTCPKKEAIEQLCGIDEDDCDSDEEVSVWLFAPSESDDGNGTESSFAHMHPSGENACQGVTFKCPKWILHRQLKLGFTEV